MDEGPLLSKAVFFLKASTTASFHYLTLVPYYTALTVAHPKIESCKPPDFVDSADNFWVLLSNWKRQRQPGLVGHAQFLNLCSRMFDMCYSLPCIFAPKDKWWHSIRLPKLSRFC